MVDLEAEQPVDLDDEGAVHQVWEPFAQRVTLGVVHHEELAPGLVLPAQARVGRASFGSSPRSSVVFLATTRF